MRHVAGIACLLATSLASANAAELTARFEWMLPKTVLDTTVAYQFQGCSANGSPNFKITPTISAKTVADQNAGQRAIYAEQLVSLWDDRNISVQTAAGSRIITGLGSSPTGQIGQILTNVIGGIGKIIGIASGFSVNAETPGSPPIPGSVCDKDGDIAKKAGQIEKLKTQVVDFQVQLANAVDDTTQKKLTAAIQASQTAISGLQDQLTVTIKTIVDPGITPIVVNADDNTEALIAWKPGEVADDGLVARICPSPAKLAKAGWITNLEKVFPGDKPNCAHIPYLTVNVYLDFKRGHSMPWDDDAAGPYKQTKPKPGDYYRDVAYIPVMVWLGNREGSNKGAVDKDGSAIGPALLAPPQVMPFGQYGVSETLPIESDGFKKMVWQLTFLENGELTLATFTNQSNSAAVAGVLQNAANTAASVANAERTAQSGSTKASQAQGDADYIYQSQRKRACESNPSTCPSK